MREILFRAKAINRDPDQEYRTEYKNGDWVYGLVEKLPMIKNGEKIYDTDCAEMRNTCGVSGIDVDENTLCEFTGLTDKNGNQIFEGDILQLCSSATPFVVYWNGLGWGAKDVNGKKKEYAFISDMVWECDKCEVIGNIYDNPELLGGVK